MRGAWVIGSELRFNERTGEFDERQGRRTWRKDQNVAVEQVLTPALVAARRMEQYVHISSSRAVARERHSFDLIADKNDKKRK